MDLGNVFIAHSQMIFITRATSNTSEENLLLYLQLSFEYYFIEEGRERWGAIVENLYIIYYQP